MAQLLFWATSPNGTSQATFVCADGHVVAYNIPNDEKDTFVEALNEWRNSLETHPPTRAQIQDWLAEAGFVDARLPHNIPSFTRSEESASGDSIAEMEQTELLEYAQELGIEDAEKLDRNALVTAVEAKLADNAQAESEAERK